MGRAIPRVVIVALVSSVMTTMHTMHTMHRMPMTSAGATTTQRVGGTIRRIDATHNVIMIHSTSLQRTYTIEVRSDTWITLSTWDANVGDMVLGDHVTVSGVPDPAHAALGPNPLLATRIRIGSPHFEGIVTAIVPHGAGGVLLIVRPRRGHAVRIDAPAGAAVTYGLQSIRPGDLVVGVEVGAHGQRMGKFDLRAATLRVHVHHYAMGGVVVGLAPGVIRLTARHSARQVLIHVLAQTRYTWSGKPVPAAMVHLGMHLRAHGYDTLHPASGSLRTMIADHVTLLLHRRTVGGIVVGRAPGVYHLINSYYGSRFSIHVTAMTRYVQGGRPVTAAAVQVGAHLRVQGLDAPHNDRPGVLTVVADRIEVYPHTTHPRHYTVVGTIISRGPSMLRLASPLDGRQVSVHVTARTLYTVAGRPVASSLVQVGMAVRAHVYNPLGGGQTGMAAVPLEASRIDVLVHLHTVGGTVVSSRPGVYRLVNAVDGSTYQVRVTAATRYTRGGRPATATAVQVGVHVRAHGYDDVHRGASAPTLIADHVEVLVPAPPRTGSGKAQASPTTPRATVAAVPGTPTGTPPVAAVATATSTR